jgi:protoporphyrinogen oxidase
VVLAGAAYDGLGLPACIRQGRQAAALALALDD